VGPWCEKYELSTVPKTDTGGLALNAKTIEIMVSKELCKIAP